MWQVCTLSKVLFWHFPFQKKKKTDLPLFPLFCVYESCFAAGEKKKVCEIRSLWCEREVVIIQYSKKPPHFFWRGLGSGGNE